MPLEAGTKLGVTDDMYQLWLDALIEAALEHDPQFTDALEARWESNDERADRADEIQAGRLIRPCNAFRLPY